MSKYPNRHLPNPGLYVHGENSVNSAEYRTWSLMKSRCYNKRNKSYKRYGGRGISVCERWLHSYETFLEDMGRKPSPAHTLERARNHEGYSLENCTWETPKVQARNRTNNRIVQFNGRSLVMAELIEQLYPGEPIDKIRARIASRMKRGFTLERSLFDSPVAGDVPAAISVG